MLRYGPLVFLVAASCAPGADAPAKGRPARILLVRHGEKTYQEGDRDLSAEGKVRAKALHGLFEASGQRPEPFPKPDFIFASSDTDKSQRPRKTVEPLAKKLGLAVDCRFKSSPEGVAALARELGKKRYQGKTVLVSWHHGRLPALAEALGVARPPDYPSKKFDRVWRIDYGKDGQAKLADLPQRLLPGDTAR